MSRCRSLHLDVDHGQSIPCVVKGEGGDMWAEEAESSYPLWRRPLPPPPDAHSWQRYPESRLHARFLGKTREQRSSLNVFGRDCRGGRREEGTVEEGGGREGGWGRQGGGGDGRGGGRRVRWVGMALRCEDG